MSYVGKTIALLIAAFVFSGRTVASDGGGDLVVTIGGSQAWGEATCIRLKASSCRKLAQLEDLEQLVQHFEGTQASVRTGHEDTLRFILAPGIHRLAHPLTINGWGKAPNEPTLVLQADEPTRTSIVGSVVAYKNTWQPASAAKTDVQLAEAVRVVNYESIVGHRAAARNRGESFGKELKPVSLEVVFAGRSMALARWPNAGYGKVAEVTEDGGGQSLVKFSAPGPHAIPQRGALIAGYLFNDWGFERVPITPASPNGAIAVLAKGATSFGVKAGQRVLVENSLAELDSPNEWFFDDDSQNLYFWPPTSSAPSDALEITVADLLLRITNSKNIRVEGLTFQNSLGDAVEVDDSASIVFDRVAVRNTENSAILIKGGDGVIIKNSLLEDIGATGIYIFGGDRRVLTPGHNLVENCEIRRFSQRIKTYQPAIRLEGVGNIARKNKIYDAPHSAIIFTGNDQLIDSNQVSDVLLESDDAGAIYTGRDWTARGSVVRNNYLRGIRGMVGAHQAVGVYLDDQASGITVDGNRFVDVDLGVLVGGGRDNVISDNIFLRAHSSIALDARGVTWQKEQTQDRNGTLWKNLDRIPVNSAQYQSRYPHLAILRDDDVGVPKYDELHWNLFIASGGIDVRNSGFFTWSETENLNVNVDVLKEIRVSPSAADEYEVERAKLPIQWPASFPLRIATPN